jgi:lysophospholipase L1-like esterase
MPLRNVVRWTKFAPAHESPSRPFPSIHGLRWKIAGGLLAAGLFFLIIACSKGSKPVEHEGPELLASAPLTQAELTKFDGEIAKFDSLLAEDVDAKGGIVFTGSSSIRKWESLHTDMAPLPVANRGFGGAIIKQVTNYSSRMIVPLHPKLVVFYCGENDIANDKYPAQMPLTDFKTFTVALRARLPKTGILFVSMKPSPLRWQYWPKFQEANRLIEDYIATQDRMWYVDVSKAMLDSNGRPLKNIYLSDSLHMNPEGYTIWTTILKPEVSKRYMELQGN